MGYVTVEQQGYITVRFGGHSIKSKAPANLKIIKRVKSWESDGYFELDTNYGEEYLDLAYVLKELGLKIDLQRELQAVETFKVEGAQQ